MEQHSWMFADTPALYQHPEERPFFPCSGPADNHDLLPINLLPDDDSSPPWLTDPDILHWFADEALNHWLDNTPHTHSGSSTPAADTLTSSISPHQTASHPLPESGSSRPHVPEAADHESLSTTATRNFNREIEIPLRPVAMKRTSRPTDERRFMQLSAKTGKQLQYGTESELKAFGWISVLGNIPQFQPVIPFTELAWVAHRIKLWDISLSELIPSNQFSAVGVKHRSWVLCEEICLRHGNLLAILTSLPTSKYVKLQLSESKAPEGVPFLEQNNLVNWLKDQVHNPPTQDDSEHLSLRSTIIDYLKSETDSEYKQKIRWETVTYRQNAPSKSVSLQQAITTQAAIKILKAYLKSTNPEKWRVLFSNEGRFVCLFKYLKTVHLHNNFSKLRKSIPEWASAGFFPWKEPLNPDHQRKLKSLFQRVDPWNEYNVMQTYFLDYDKSEKEIK